MILTSIDKEDEEIRREWIFEVKRRMQSVKEGKTELLNLETTL